MSVTFPRGFVAGSAVAGLKSSGALDVCVVASTTDSTTAAAVLTSNRVSAAPVRWTREAVAAGAVRAVVLNSGGANACTGPQGMEDARSMALAVAGANGWQAQEVAVCSTGLIGVHLPMARVTPGIDTALANAAATQAAGEQAAQAIMTTDSVPKTAVHDAGGWRIGGMAKGAGMLAPGLATMLVVITTDADISRPRLQALLERACATTFNRLDSDGCMSTNDTVLLLASGAAGDVDDSDFFDALHRVCADLAGQLQRDAEGSTKDIEIRVSGAASEQDAEQVGRAVARSALLKCAIHGEDPNWGRVLAAMGTTEATFDPDRVDVALNGVWVCRASQAGEPRELVQWPGRDVRIDIDLHSGGHTATVWTNDLTAMYVHENSAYAT